MMIRRLLIPLLMTAQTGLASQEVPPDAGTLVIRQNATIVAQESYQIRHDGSVLTVTSTARWGSANTVVLAVYTPRRVTIRLSGTGGEIAREFPSGGTLILHDSAFVFLMLLPQYTAGPVRLAQPRRAERLAAILADHGLAGASPRQEREFVLSFEGDTIRAWFDADGTFLRAMIPSRNLEITRLSNP